MPEQSPSDARLLEPVDVGTELRTTSDESIHTALRVAHEESQPTEFVRRKVGLGFWLAVGWVTVVVLLAVLAPLLTSWGILPDPNKIGRPLYGNPSPQHWLGTDLLGRDQLARLIYGARVSLPVGFASITLGLLVGGTIGILAGYLKGWSDNVLMTFMDIILAFPALLLALSIVSFTDQKTVGVISLAIGIISVPQLSRLVRANTLTFREREFVLASRTLGASHARIIFREILPNVVPPVLSFAIIGVAVAIAAESYLAFVGVSVPLPTSTWGGMIQQAQEGLTQGHPFQVFLPCTVLVLTIISFYLIGDRLGQKLNVRESAL